MTEVSSWITCCKFSITFDVSCVTDTVAQQRSSLILCWTIMVLGINEHWLGPPTWTAQRLLIVIALTDRWSRKLIWALHNSTYDVRLWQHVLHSAAVNHIMSHGIISVQLLNQLYISGCLLLLWWDDLVSLSYYFRTPNKLSLRSQHVPLLVIQLYHDSNSSAWQTLQWHLERQCACECKGGQFSLLAVHMCSAGPRDVYQQDRAEFKRFQLIAKCHVLRYFFLINHSLMALQPLFFGIYLKHWHSAMSWTICLSP